MLNESTTIASGTVAIPQFVVFRNTSAIFSMFRVPNYYRINFVLPKIFDSVSNCINICISIGCIIFVARNKLVVKVILDRNFQFYAISYCQFVLIR